MIGLEPLCPDAASAAFSSLKMLPDPAAAPFSVIGLESVWLDPASTPLSLLKLIENDKASYCLRAIFLTETLLWSLCGLILPPLHFPS